MPHYVIIHEAAHEVGWLGPFPSKAAAETQKRELAATLGHGYAAKVTTRAKKNPAPRAVRAADAFAEQFDDALGGHAGIRDANAAKREVDRLMQQGRYEEAAAVLGRATGKRVSAGTLKAARVGAALATGGASELVRRGRKGR